MSKICQIEEKLENYNGGMLMQRENIYEEHIEKVKGYIQEHMNQELSLKRLADVAAFSPYHFHRIFTVMVGETLNQYVTRVRMDQAVRLLKSDPEAPITDVALECGFSRLSVFSRAFKQRYGINPRQWNRQNLIKESRNFEEKLILPFYSIDELEAIGNELNLDVQIDDVPAMIIAYVRVQYACGAGHMQQGYQTLIDWYEEQGEQRSKATIIGLSLDDHGQEPLDQCRYDFGIIIKQDYPLSKAVKIQQIPSFKAARLHCVGDNSISTKILQYLYRYWLPRSGYLPADLPFMEIYNQHPTDIGWEKFDVDVLLPIQ